MLARRGAIWLACTVVLAGSACNAILGVDDLPGLEDAGATDGAVFDGAARDSGTGGGGGHAGGAGGGGGGGVTAGGGGGGVAGGGGGGGGVGGGGGGSDAGADGSVDGGVLEFQSCQAGGGGRTNCGSASESCCTSLEVPSGMFYRTYTNTGTGGTGLADPASVSGLRVDKYPVTVGRFRQFVAAWNTGSGWLPPAGSGKHAHLNSGKGLANSGSPGTFEPGWVTSDNSNIAPADANLTCDPNFATWTSSPGANENLPITCVNGYEAFAFCIWDGGFLPSEAEWEYVAAGGNQQREYPWGNTAPGTACPGSGCQYAIYGCYYPNGSGSCTNVSNLAPVGTATLGAGLWGQLDVAGDASEWVLDWYASYVDPCTDCAYLTVTSQHVILGSNWETPLSQLSLPSRGGGGATIRNPYLGFRCARSP
jgi:formylglycine-generating enzyme required for sulfatase activity